MYKQCNRCKEFKTADNFNRYKASKDGLYRICKACRRILTKAYREKYAEQIKKRKQIYYQNNREAMYKRHKKYVSKNREKCLKYHKDYYHAHANKMNQQRKEWYYNHLEETRERNNEYKKHKRKINISFRLSENMRHLVYQSLKGKKNGKHWEDIIGYTIDDLKKHLEAQFIDGMTWETYGKDGWHLDHIVPKSVFNFKSYDHIDFKRCWALENLQPLWGEENLRKRDKFSEPFQPCLAF